MNPKPGPQNLPPPTEPGGPDVTTPIPQPAGPPRQTASAPPTIQQPMVPPQSPEPQAGDINPEPVNQSSPSLVTAVGQVETPPGPSEQSKDEQPSRQIPQPTQPETDEAEEAKQELRDAIQESNEVLATASTLFPFMSETFTLDRTKLTVSRRSLVGSAEVMSIRVEDVLNAAATVGPFFGSIQITNRVASQSTTHIGPFWRRDALRLKRITQGYVIAIQKQIDVSKLSSNELEHMLERLGEDDHTATNVEEEPRS